MAEKTPAAASVGAVSSAALAFLRRSPVAIPLLTALAALLVALRIVERAEIWLDRTWWLVGTAAFGGLVGAAVARIILGSRLLRRLAARSPHLVSASLFTCLFMLGMMAAYVAQNMIFGGQFEPHPERPVRAVLVNAIQTAALFLISCPTYLLPWPLPALAALAGLLLAPETPADPAKPVE